MSALDRGNHHHAPAVPLRRQRVPDRRQAGPPARHPGHIHGDGPGTGILRHHRAGAHRADPQQRPQDRRSIIEEAAGITKFKTRRRLAEAKLEGAKQNLTRVFDILEEVGRQVNSLKRQASKARRYEELKARWWRRCAAPDGPLPDAGARRGQDRAGPERRHGRSAALTQAVAEREQEQARLQERLYRTETELTDARKRLAELRLDAERTRGRLESQARQIGVHRPAADPGRGGVAGTRPALGSAGRSRGAERVSRNSKSMPRGAPAAGAEERRARRAAGAVRARERAMEAGRQAVLRLLGEASV